MVNELAKTEKPSNMIVAGDQQKFLDTNKYNPVFFTESLISNLPAGVEMVPNVLKLPDWDYWTKKEVPFLKQGQAMLSANAVTKIANAAGITLKRIIDDVTTIPAVCNGVDGKVIHEAYQILRIEYEATMILPDGTSLMETGGKEEIYTPGKNHSREKIDKKARRNALKNLLSLPTTLPQSEVEKPMVVWKTIFKRGGEVDHVVDALETQAKASIGQLYGETSMPAEVLPANGAGGIEKTVTIQANVFQTLSRLIDGAENAHELGNAVAAIQKADLSDEETKKLRQAYSRKEKQLQQQSESMF